MAIIDMDKIGEALNTKADTDLNNTGVFSTSGGWVNLTSSTPADAIGKEVTSADFFQSNLLNYTTNRILEIPQDIKLELNNGTLTLKAGSKVYVPNGFEADGTTPKFDVVLIENDIHAGGMIGSFTDKWVFCYRNNGFYLELLSHCFSGSTLPTQTGENRLGYNTTLNKFQGSTNGGAYIDDICSFPVCIFSTNSGVITSIDQIFNGFVYIGSTVFVLPGVKVQIPNGRNTDGTCKSVYGTIRTVQQTSANPGNGDFSIRIGDNYIAVSKFVYDEETNYNYNQTVSPSNIRYQNNAGTVSYSSGRITSLKPYTVDSVLNSNLSNLSAAGEAKLKSNIRLVNELPANPEPGVLYCIPEA